MKKKLRLSKPAWIGLFVAVAAVIVVLGVAVASLFADGSSEEPEDKNASASDNGISVSSDELVVRELTPADDEVSENEASDE
ncbi:MAG: hypothetical protein J6X66_06165 [Lachnospiraceae bacterium]|nr:hypothetical protein [Lachnospiraceae bacterium]